MGMCVTMIRTHVYITRLGYIGLILLFFEHITDASAHTYTHILIPTNAHTYTLPL